jgi:hypothetical protein
MRSRPRRPLICCLLRYLLDMYGCIIPIKNIIWELLLIFTSIFAFCASITTTALNVWYLPWWGHGGVLIVMRSNFCHCRLAPSGTNSPYYRYIIHVSILTTKILQWVSGWLLFNANSAIFQLYHSENKLIFNEMIMKSALYETNTLSWIFIVLVHWNNSPRICMSPHSNTLSWFRANQSLLFLLMLRA